MDISRVEPEDALVHCETVEADASMDFEEEVLFNDYGKEDKVLVSIRCVTAIKWFL